VRSDVGQGSNRELMLIVVALTVAGCCLMTTGAMFAIAYITMAVSICPRRNMAYTAILKRIRLLIPAKLDGHYDAVCRAFAEGDLTGPPSLSISDRQLARAISEFTGFPPNEASIATP
jgi:hypothetical protein